MPLTTKYDDDHTGNQRDLKVYAGTVLVATITVYGGDLYYTNEITREEYMLLSIANSGAIVTSEPSKL